MPPYEKKELVDALTLLGFKKLAGPLWQNVADPSITLSIEKLESPAAITSKLLEIGAYRKAQQVKEVLFIK